MKKQYYIVQAIAGCIGGNGSTSRMPERFTNKQHAEKQCNTYKKSNSDKRVIYWVDFEWI